MSTSSSSVDLLKCSAGELASYLLEHRFKNDGMATTAFLLEGTTSLPYADVIAAQIMNQQEEAGDNHDNNDNNKDDDAATTHKSPSKSAAAAAAAAAAASSNSKEVVSLVSSHSEESSSTNHIINNNNTAKGMLSSLGPAWQDSPVELSLTNPRGKFHISFHQDGIHAVTVKNPLHLLIPAGTVQHVIVFPKPTDCQRTSTSNSKKQTAVTTSPMILLCFKDNHDNSSNHSIVSFKDKPLSQICFALPTTIDPALDAAIAKTNVTASAAADAWIQLLCRSLQLPYTQQVYHIPNPNDPNNNVAKNSNSAWTFRSYQEANKSTTAGGMPFVKCYHGVQDGCLYPMEQGLLFFKPPLFLPRSKLHSISCGRGNGSASRYVDMVITTNNDDNDGEEGGEETLEFTNIFREELGVLNNYIYKVLIPAMQRDQVATEDATSKPQNKNIKTNDETRHSSDEDGDDDDASDAVAAAAVVDEDDNKAEVVVAVDSSNSTDDDDIEVVHVSAGNGRHRSKRLAARDAMEQTKQHFLQHQMKNGGRDDDDDNEDDDSEDDAPFVDGEYDEDGDDVGDQDDDLDEEDLSKADMKPATKRGRGKKKGGDESDMDNEGDDDDDDEVEVVEEEDLVQTDGEETEDDEDDQEEETPPEAKKRRSK